MERKTLVVFRKWKKDGEIIALFPQVSWNLDNSECASYMHIGQHSGAEYQFVLMQTVPATKEEYKPLYEELTNRGYNLCPIMSAEDIHAVRKMFDYSEQEITDMLITLSRFEIMNMDTNRKVSASSAIRKLGVMQFLNRVNRCTYHWTAVNYDENKKNHNYFIFSKKD